MKLQRNLERYTLSANCEEDLRPQAESVLEKLAELDRGGPRLQDGTQIRFGWSLFRLKAEGEILVVCEPDFVGNPLLNFIPSIDTTVRVLRDQSRLLTLAHVDGNASNFDDKIVLQRGCLDIQRVYLERRPAQQAHDSGWYIGPTESSARSEDFEAIYVYQLLLARAALIQVLALPWHYLTVFDGDRLQSIVNEKNEEIWRISGRNQGGR